MIKRIIYYESKCNNLVTIVVEKTYFLGILIKQIKVPYEIYKKGPS